MIRVLWLMLRLAAFAVFVGILVFSVLGLLKLMGVV